MKSKILSLKTLLWLSILTIVFLFSSCEKDPLELCRKDPTCEYFVCKVNGERWEPDCNSEPLFGCSSFDVQYYKKSGFLEAIIKNEKSKTGLKLELRDIKFKNTKYEFESASGYYNSNNLENCTFFNVSNEKINEISFQTIDTIHYYIKAKFSMITLNDCGKEVKITDGEFNLQYRF